MSKDERPTGSGYWKPINFGWKYLNYVIVGVGLVVGFYVWVLPNQWAAPGVQEGLAKTAEKQRLYKEYQEQLAIKKAEDERIARYNDEVGLVYIEPGTNPFLPPDAKRDGEQ